jgi:hypothetical protein
MLETILQTIVQKDNSVFFTPLNALISILGFIVAWIYGKKAYLSTNTDVRMLAIGIAATAGGLAIQRGYWTVVRMITTIEPTYTEILYKHWSWITFIPLLIVIYGYSKHLQLAICENFGRFSFWKYLFLIIMFYFILFFGGVFFL